MCFKRETNGNIELVTLTGRLDTERARKLTSDFDEISESGTGKTIVLMDSVEYISSSMLMVLLQSLKRHRAVKGDLRLVGLQPQIMKVIKIAGLDALFNIHEDKESALKAFED